MAAPKQQVFGLDIRKDSICMAQYSLAEPAITNVTVQPIEAADTPEEWWKCVAVEIRKLAGEASLKGADVVCALPFEAAIVKNLAVDKDEEDVGAALAWEVEQQILGSLDEYVYDYQKLPVSDGATDRYLLVGYRSEAVKRLGDLVKSNRMNPVAVDLDMFGLVNAFEANYVEKTAQPAVLVFAEYNRLSVLVTRQGTLVDFETEARSLDPDRPEETAAAIRQLLARLQKASPSAFTGQAPQLYGAGSLLCTKGFGSALAAQVPGFEQLSPFKCVPARVSKIPEDDINKFAPQLAVAVGLAIRGGVEITS